MQHDGDRSEPDNQRELSDDGADVARTEQKLDCGSILSKLDWKRLLRKLKPDELILFKLYYLEQNSPSEIAGLLGKPSEDVEQEINRLRNKIKSRARTMVKGTPLEKALLDLEILPLKKRAEKKRPVVAKPDGDPGGTTAKKKSVPAERAKARRLEKVLFTLGFRLAD